MASAVLGKPLLAHQEVTKARSIFGWWPLRQEVWPLDPEGKPDKALVLANILAGTVIGIRQTLGAIMTASLVFTSAGVPEISAMFPFGITMMWFSSAVAALWYGLFGRLQYALIGINDVIGILWGTAGSQVAISLLHAPNKMPPTLLAIIALSTALTGIASLTVGKLGLGKLMLLFPAPVTNGFLGSIGLFVFKSSLQIASGTKFKYLWPVDLDSFVQAHSLGRVASMFAMLIFIRNAPARLQKCFPASLIVKKLGGLFCQLFPLVVFFGVTLALGISMDELTDAGWTYPSQGSNSAISLWTTYDLREADASIVLSHLPSMGLIALLSVLCTMTGVLGISGKFPQGPPGDPAPMDQIDYDVELITAGWGDLILSLSGGVVTFHRLGSTVQLRMDGGTHRLALFTCSAFCGLLFLSGIPIGHFMPTWFLGALFMNSAVALLKDAVLSYKTLPPSDTSICGKKFPSVQYVVTLACMVAALVVSPFAGIGTGLILSIVLFLYESSQAKPLRSVSSGSVDLGKVARPVWELRCLRQQGDRIVMLFLQGQLFFGSADSIDHVIADAIGHNRVRYCILSFRHVVSIDASAAKAFKASVGRAASLGCKVIFCDLKTDVFTMLYVAGVIKAPDPYFVTCLRNRGVSIEFEQDDSIPQVPIKAVHTKEKQFDKVDGSLSRATSSGFLTAEEEEEDQPELEFSVSTTGPHPSRQRVSFAFKPIGSGEFDAFDTNIDALDFCGDVIVGEFVYGENASAEVPFAPAQGDPYKMAYRHACRLGQRLDENSFEQLNSLPKGTMAALKSSCKVMNNLSHGTDLTIDGIFLYFLFRGAIASVDKLVGDDERRQLSLNMGAEVQGFSGRDGSRLRLRYMPGSVVGKLQFFLDEDSLVDKQVLPSLIVSSRVSGYCEVWALSKDKFDALPTELREIITKFVLVTLAQATGRLAHVQ